jgi:hypothetical protein
MKVLEILPKMSLKSIGVLLKEIFNLGNYANFSVRALTDQGTDDTFSKSNGVGLSVNINTC